MSPSEIKTVEFDSLSNAEFLAKFARPGCIGLAAGTTLIDKAIFRAERHVYEKQKWGAWSHAFLFEGCRPDGRHWVMESDLEIAHKNIKLGVQENRIDKYHDEELYSSLAILDFDLTEKQTSEMISNGLDLIANRSKYSMRELFGTLFALRHPKLRKKENLLSRESSFFCSAFVSQLFSLSGLNLSAHINIKNITPEDIFCTSLPHKKYLLDRRKKSSSTLRDRIRTKVKSIRKT